MVNVIEVRTRAQMRAFFKAAASKGYKKEEIRYLKTYCVPPMNPLFHNGPQAYLYCERDGKPVFRALTGMDRMFAEKTGRKLGYFSLFEGEEDEEATKCILNEIMKRQKEWGAEEVRGPVSPDGSGFFMGAGEGDFYKDRGLFTGVENGFIRRILIENGFEEADSENAYRMETPKENPLLAVTSKAGERFGVRIKKMKPGVFDERWKKEIARVTDHLPEGETALFLDRIRKYIDKNHSFVAFEKGEVLGYLVSFKKGKGILRATTLMTKTGAFVTPCVLNLIDAFLSSVRRRNILKFEISVINERNIRSERLVLRFGGEKTRRYTQFTKKVREN